MRLERYIPDVLVVIVRFLFAAKQGGSRDW